MSHTLIDRDARNRYAFLLRQLVSGNMRTDRFQFEAELLAIDSNDLILREIHPVVDSLYSDLWDYRLRGRMALASETKGVVARMILALRSDLEQTAPWPGLVDGPLGWRDLLLVFAAIVALLVLASNLAFLGFALGIVCIAASLIILHRRENCWHDENRARISVQHTWPFVDSALLRRAAAQPVFLVGYRTSSTFSL